ncbi:unnamed protein product, partial [Rangifer tarandus platyrhynchus]
MPGEGGMKPGVWEKLGYFSFSCSTLNKISGSSYVFRDDYGFSVASIPAILPGNAWSLASGSLITDPHQGKWLPVLTNL